MGVGDQEPLRAVPRRLAFEPDQVPRLNTGPANNPPPDTPLASESAPAARAGGVASDLRTQRAGSGIPLRLGRFRYSAVELLIVLVLFFLSAPFIEKLPGGDLIEAILATLLMVSAVMVVGGQPGTFRNALLLLVPAVLGKWAHHFWPSLLLALTYLVAGSALFGYVVAHLVRFILRVQRVDANVLCAGLSGYVLLGMLWVPFYLMAAKLDPSAFTLSQGAGSTMDSFNCLYFSFITLCTVGYGDVVPVSKGARILAITEAVAGLFYMAVLVSRLVAIYSSNPAPNETSPGKDR
jgi:hypothetical protein